MAHLPQARSSPRRAAALGYRHVGCLQLSRVRTANPSADGRRSAASRTAIGVGHIVSLPPGRCLVRLELFAVLQVHTLYGRGTVSEPRLSVPRHRRELLRAK